MEGQKVIIKQTKSTNGRTQGVKDNLVSLGLGKIGRAKNHTLTADIIGKVRKVKHLVEVRKDA
jgi:large subunit ribosomal protein L30